MLIVYLLGFFGDVVFVAVVIGGVSVIDVVHFAVVAGVVVDH